MHEILQHVALTDTRHECLGASQRINDIRAALVGELGDLPGSANKLPVDRVALDHGRVVLDTDRGRKFGDQLAQIASAADVLQTVPSRQLVGDRDLVYGLAAVPEGAAGFVHPAVLLSEEVL